MTTWTREMAVELAREQYERGRAEMAAEVERLRLYRQAGLALHVRTRCDHSGPCISEVPHDVCDHCNILWPCATARALGDADPEPSGLMAG